MNHSKKDLKWLMDTVGVVPVVNEISLDLYSYASQRDLIEFHAEHGILTVARDSLT